MTRILPSRPPVQKPAKVKRNPAHMARVLIPAMADRIEALEADVATALEAMSRVEVAMAAWNELQDKASFGALSEALDQMNMARAQITGIPR